MTTVLKIFFLGMLVVYLMSVSVIIGQAYQAEAEEKASVLRQLRRTQSPQIMPPQIRGSDINGLVS